MKEYQESKNEYEAYKLVLTKWEKMYGQKADEEHFRVFVKVAVSSHFLGWVMALGEGAKIVGPQFVVDPVEREIDRLIRQYRDADG